MSKWEIDSATEGSEYLSDLLSENWEPFAVTVEKRSETNFDTYTNRDYTDTFKVNLIWLRRGKEC